MSEENGHTLAKTFDCKTPGCVREARSSVGRYSYCEPCQRRRATERGANPAAGASLVAQLEGMKSLAKQADAADAKARKLTTQALAAKARADALRQQLAAAMRDMAAPA